MNGAWSCPVCGSRSRHYNRARLALVCDQCGRAVVDPEQELQRRQYDRAMQLAREHLRVGNWDQCRRTVQPWLDRYPAERLNYQLLLATATRGYTDLLLSDFQGAADARGYWEKLAALRGLNAAMTSYAARRIHARKQQLRRTRNVTVTAMLLAGGVVLAAGALGNGLLLMAAMLAAVVLLHKLWQSLKPVESIRALRRIEAGQFQNPFDI